MLMRRPRLTICAALVLACTLALALAGPAPAQDEIAPPYRLTTGPGATTLNVRPDTGITTIALTVTAGAGNVVFTPAAENPLPVGCTSSTTATTCPASLMSSALDIDAAVVQVDISGVATTLMRIDGGNDTDTIAVRGPAAPGAVDRLDVFTGPGADELTVRGRVSEIHDDSGAAGPPAADQSPDRYVIESPSITGELEPAGGDDIVVTDAPALALDGSDGNDTLTGPGTLTGGDGNDLLKPTTPATSAAGGPGTDRVSYEMIATALPIALTGGGGVTVDGVAAVTEVEEVEGGAGNDTMTGDGAANVLAGGAGDDILDGRGAADDLDGGTGSDTVSYATESAAVAVALGAGTGGPAGATDVLRSFDGVVTGAGNDSVVGTGASERFALGAGDDALDAGDGNDGADGGAGNDVLRGGPGSDFLTGGPGADTVMYDERTSGEPVVVVLGAPGSGGTGAENDVLMTVENVVGTPGPDSLSGDGAANALVGGFGEDSIAGHGGDDLLFGGEHRDVMNGGTGNDSIFGQGGDDSLAAFDNEADVVDCGESLDDDAQVDPFDRVVGCEYARRLDIPVPVDNDGDGIVASFDCNDSDPGLRPGATDVPGDGIDQNCDGFDEALPFVSGSPGLTTRTTSKGRRVRSLRVDRVPARSVVRVRCIETKKHRRACAFTRRTRTSTSIRRPMSFTRYFKNRSLAAGTRIEMRITAPGRIGKVWTYRINKRTAPRETVRCLTNGSRPRVCPPEER